MPLKSRSKSGILPHTNQSVGQPLTQWDRQLPPTFSSHLKLGAEYHTWEMINSWRFYENGRVQAFVNDKTVLLNYEIKPFFGLVNP